LQQSGGGWRELRRTLQAGLGDRSYLQSRPAPRASVGGLWAPPTERVDHAHTHPGGECDLASVARGRSVGHDGGQLGPPSEIGLLQDPAGETTPGRYRDGPIDVPRATSRRPPRPGGRRQHGRLHHPPTRGLSTRRDAPVARLALRLDPSTGEAPLRTRSGELEPACSRAGCSSAGRHHGAWVALNAASTPTARPARRSGSISCPISSNFSRGRDRFSSHPRPRPCDSIAVTLVRSVSVVLRSSVAPRPLGSPIEKRFALPPGQLLRARR
jgi:hypothetical protein